MYQNPGNGVFYFTQNGNRNLAEDITLFNSPGEIAGMFKDAASFDISRQPAVIYPYQVSIYGQLFNGKLIKR